MACEERRDADTDYSRRKFLKHSSGCWPLVNETREALVIHENRLPSVDDHARNGKSWQEADLPMELHSRDSDSGSGKGNITIQAAEWSTQLEERWTWRRRKTRQNGRASLDD